jgi:hypothetical protein
MRGALTLFLGGLTLVTGLFAAVVQASNHERARALAELQRAWEHLEAVNLEREARAAAHIVAGQGSAPAERVREALP